MSVLERYRSRVSQICGEWLGDYTRRLRAAERARASSKEFNDPVWGTLVIQPLELMLLDSPLFQRLRYIRQLGVVHWVYPAATHTRFEHTLGVVSQAQELIDAVNSRDPKKPSLIDEDLTRVLRLAALCHDIGHGAMSHVSENALLERREVEDLRLEFADAQNDEPAQLSEIAAFYMVGSPAFHELLTLASELAEVIFPGGAPAAAKDIQQTIVGKRIRDTHPLIHELISGPFDADKLDYMRRDAQFTGVPVVTDIARLIRKVRACCLPPARLPSELSSTIPDTVDVCYITGIDVSGGRTLDELMLGRTLLFDKVYRHQKVRAAETLVGEIVRSFASSGADDVAFLPLQFTDEQMLHAQPNGEDAEVVLDLQKRARNRELPVRAMAFAQSMPLDPFADDDLQVAGLAELASELRNPDRKRGLLQEIAAEVRKMLALAPRDGQVDPVVRDHLERYIALDPPSSRAGSGRIDRAFLIHPGDELSRFREESVQSDFWLS